MHAYRFRLLIEDQDDFLRDIDVLANQTFEDFNNFLLKHFELPAGELSSFYICDHKWRKLKELTLIDMQQDLDEDDDPDEKPSERKRLPVFVMSEAKIKDIIDDPHQRIIFEYDFLNPVTLYLELMRINPAEKGKNYPLVARSSGAFTRSPVKQRVNNSEFSEDLLTSDDDLLDDMFEVDGEEAEFDESTAW